MSAFDTAMDIRGIAWAGYFFTSGTSTTEYLCVDPPDISADDVDALAPDISADELVPIITAADADCPC